MTERDRLFSKDFVLILIGQVISLFGNHILRFALPLYLLNQTGSSALFGTVSAVSFIPMIILFPIGGIIADRVNKKNIMVILDFSTAVLALIFALTSGPHNYVVFIAVTMLILYAVQGMYQPAVYASIPALSGKKHIVKANSVVNMISSLANMLGPVLGGLLFASAGFYAVLYISAVSFLASAIMEMFIQIPFVKREKKQNILALVFRDMGESFGFLARDKPILLKTALLYGLVNMLLCSLINIALPVLFTQNLGLAEDMANRLYGYSQGIIAIGSILGSLLAGALSKKLKAQTVCYNILGCSLCVLIEGFALKAPLSALTVFVVLTICSSLLMALMTIFQIQMMSYVQILTPKNLTGKVVSCVICICMCSNPVGQFVYGFLLEQAEENFCLLFITAAVIAEIIGFSSRGILTETESEIT